MKARVEGVFRMWRARSELSLRTAIILGALGCSTSAQPPPSTPVPATSAPAPSLSSSGSAPPETAPPSAAASASAERTSAAPPKPDIPPPGSPLDRVMKAHFQDALLIRKAVIDGNPERAADPAKV